MYLERVNSNTNNINMHGLGKIYNHIHTVMFLKTEWHILSLSLQGSV